MLTFDQIKTSLKHLFFLFLISYSIVASSQKLGDFKAENQPASPDYSLAKNWAAFPFTEDETDEVPDYELAINDSLKKVDVFYIYPTVYLNGKTWNADINNKSLNGRIDKYPVKYHGTVFNQVARVYAPRYRQAILQSFWDTTGNGEKALAFAYEDVKRAFIYFLENHSKGRPIIIASHSQGSYHARRLLYDFFDEPAMKKRLVCAYVIGFGMNENKYSTLTPCANANETNCYVTWASFKQGFVPKATSPLFGDVCVNPISWTLDTLVAENNGGILLNINKEKGFKTKVQIKNNYLWVKTNTPIVGTMRNMHIADYNLFWLNIRQNVALRVSNYLKENK